MKFRMWWVPIALVGLFAAACGGWLLWSKAVAQAKVERPVALRPVKTQVANFHPGGDVLMQTGEIKPARYTDLAFQIGGKLLRRDVEIGNQVRAGQVIGNLDDVEVQNELRIAQAELENAETALKLNKAEWDRAQQLQASNAIARANVEAASANWESAQSKLKAAKASLENAKRKLSYTQLIAVQSGVVTSVGANSGEVVGAGQMVARIAVDNERDAVFDVAERMIASTPDNVVVHVSLCSNPAIVATGHVREVSPTADPLTRTYRVKIALKDAPEAMGYGATVTGKVELPTNEHVSVPAVAITRDAESPAVFVVDPETKTLQTKKVQVLRYTDHEALIADGIQQGDFVVIAGVSKLRTGQAVRLEVVKP